MSVNHVFLWPEYRRIRDKVPVGLSANEFLSQLHNRGS